MRTRGIWMLAAATAVAAIVSCDASEDPSPATSTPGEATSSPPAVADASTEEPTAPATPTPSPAPTPAPTPAPSPEAPLGDADPRPEWLGTRELPVREDGLGEVRETPPALRDRRLPPPADGPDLPTPPDDGRFASTVQAVPDHVAARSTWRPECPVDLDELRYATVTFWGFDGRPHTGELLVHQRVAEDVVGVFHRLFDARFPIEEMRVVAHEELDAPPTGDGNNSTAFVCREVTSGSSWSQHAFGLAVDINPFHNPYARGDTVVPELASAYLDRSQHRPGMIQPGDVATQAFADIGWGWGGAWQSAKDWMHFSESGR